MLTLHFMSKVYYNLNDFKSDKGTIITIGTFDGVHLGHQKLLNQLNELQKNTDLETLVFTFNPHPRKILFPTQGAPHLITSTAEKIELLKKAGVDHILLYPFSKEFSEIDPEHYIRSILKEKLNVKKIIIGYDHKFGFERKGDINTLKQFSSELGFEVHEISAEDINKINVSSTFIRKALDTGQVELAASFLGHSYFITGKVIEGKKLGRQFGYPTANVHIEERDKLIPLIGVYAVYVEYNQQLYKGMLNIGINPTTDKDNKIKIEVNIFDFNEDIYNREIRIKFVKRLRDEFKFANLDELVAQLHQDKLDSLEVLK